MSNFFLSIKNSIFSSMVLTFVIIISPLYIFGFFIYSSGVESIKNELFNSMMQQVRYYLDNLENEIQRIKILQYDCLNDEDLNCLASAPESLTYYEKSQAILRLQRRLYTIKNSSRYIHGIYAYIPSIGKTIPDSGSIDQSIPGRFDILKDYPPYGDQQIHYINNELILSASSADIGINRTSIFILEIRLADTAFQSELVQMNTYERSKTLLFDPSQDYLAFSGPEGEEIFHYADLLKRQPMNGKDEVKTVKIGEKQYLLIYAASDYLHMLMAKYIPADEVYKPLRRYRNWFLMLTFAAFVVIVLFSLSTYKIVHRPLLKLVKSFRKVEEGVLDIKIAHNHNDEFRYLYQRFNSMVENLNILIDQVYRQKILNQRAELKQLQSQINPHFLFNSFYILQRMIIDDDKGGAGKFSKQLGNYFKYVARNASDEIALEKEVEHAKVYAEIQGMRFSKRLSVMFGDLPDPYRDIIVPRLILQPIIENAFEHGLKSKESGGFLRVQFSGTEYKLQIITEDNGGDMTDDRIEQIKASLYGEDSNTCETTAIVNIHRRLRLKFGPDSGLMVFRSIDGGLKVIINIECENKEAARNVPFVDSR